VYRAPGPLRIEPAEECRNFITIADYVREVGRWMESDVAARDLASWWPRAEGMRNRKAVASGCLSWMDAIGLDVHSARNPGSIMLNRHWAKYYQKLVEKKPQWLPQSLAIAESLRRG
jgi:hypothetical protein